MDGKISWVGVWVTVLSPNDISVLRRSENATFGTKVASSTKTCTWIFGKSFLIVEK